MKKKPYDLIYTSGTLTPFIWLIKYSIRIPVCALILVNLEDEFIKFKVTNNRIIHKIIRHIDIFSVNQYSAVFFPSKSLYERHVKLGLPEKRAFVINRAVAVPEFSLLPKTVNSDIFSVLYTGSFVDVQNLELLLEVAGLLEGKEIIIQLIGANESEFASYTKDIRIRKLGNTVKLLPRMQPDQLESYIKATDIVVSPRIFGFHDTPMKIFYYLYYGKCILATDYPIHTEVLDTNTAILVKDNPDAFAAKILELKDNPELIREKEKAALKLYQAKYTREIQVAHYRDIFQKITGTNQESDQHRSQMTL